MEPRQRTELVRFLQQLHADAEKYKKLLQFKSDLQAGPNVIRWQLLLQMGVNLAVKTAIQFTM